MKKSILKVLLKLYTSPTGPTHFEETYISPARMDQMRQKSNSICNVHIQSFNSIPYRIL